MKVLDRLFLIVMRLFFIGVAASVLFPQTPTLERVMASCLLACALSLGGECHHVS